MRRRHPEIMREMVWPSGRWDRWQGWYGHSGPRWSTTRRAAQAGEQCSKTLAWIANHAACLYNLDAVGPDGKVPFERWRGRRHNMQRCVFGEKVWYMPSKLSGRSKAEDRMAVGGFIGIKLKSSEYVVIADGEVRTARTIRRRSEGERWENPEAVLDVPVLPWDRPGHPRATAVRPAGDRGGETERGGANTSRPS